MAKQLFQLDPAVDRQRAADTFARDGRVQLQGVLTGETAAEIRSVLARGTPWGVATQAGEAGQPHAFTSAELASEEGKTRVEAAAREAHRAASHGKYAFAYARYSLVEAYLGKWNLGGPHDLLLEYLNAPDFLTLVREVTGIGELVKADGTATLFGPGHFLGRHIDSHLEEGWRVAYVLNFTVDGWHPDWGGHLVFLDEDGNVEHGYAPRFNTLNLFAVPRSHAVTYVPPYAPVGRYAITGWLRDR